MKKTADGLNKFVYVVYVRENRDWQCLQGKSRLAYARQFIADLKTIASNANSVFKIVRYKIDRDSL